MITPSEIYLIGIADNLISMFSVICFLSILASGLCFFIYFLFPPILCIYGEERKKFREHFKFMKTFSIIGIVSFFVSFSISTFFPSSKTLAAMYVVPAIANSQVAQQLPEYIEKLLKKDISQ